MTRKLIYHKKKAHFSSTLALENQQAESIATSLQTIGP